MNVFQQSAMITAFTILMVLFIFIGMMLNKSSNGKVVADNCPDYWITSNYEKPKNACSTSEFGCCSDYATPKTDADGTNCPIKCYNSQQLGKTSKLCTSIPKVMDFGTDEFSGTSGLCKKQTWAKQCDLTWDGVTNIPSAC